MPTDKKANTKAIVAFATLIVVGILLGVDSVSGRSIAIGLTIGLLVFVRYALSRDEK